MIHKTNAMALRVDPFSRTSQIVSWLTPGHGRLVTLAKGAQRPRSDFRGQIDVFYTCEIVYYSSTRSGLSTLKECTALETREPLRNDIRASACASYLCDLVQHLTPPETPQESLFRFMDECLNALCAQDAAVPGRIVHWAELRLMGLLGMAPRLDSCTACGRATSQSNPLNTISVPQGGVVCAVCRSVARGPMIPLGLDAMAILKAWQSGETPLRARRTACSPEQRTGIGKTLGALLAYHLDLPLSRPIALDLLAV